MAASDILEQLGVDFSTGTVGNIGFTISIFFLVAGLVGIATYFYISKKSYNKQIYIFGEVNGITQRIGSDTAKEVVLPFTSIRAFYLKKTKVFLPRPSIQTDKNEFWYFIRDDGEWVNIGLGNLNRILKQLGLKYDHTDMRMSNASLKKLVEKNYKKTNWLKEYAPYIAIGIMILMLGITAFLVVREGAAISGGLASITNEVGELLEVISDLLSKTDNIVSGSGIRSA